MGSLATIFLSFDEMPGFISGTAQHPLTHARAFIHRAHLYLEPLSAAGQHSTRQQCAPRLRSRGGYPLAALGHSVKVDKRKRFIANPV